MSKEQTIQNFDPNGVGINNANFIGLPFTKEEADIILLPVPWDVTTSFSDGTSRGPQNILDASYQLDLYNHNYKDIWRKGIFFEPVNHELLQQNDNLRYQAKKYIEFLEDGGKLENNSEMQELLQLINEACEDLNNWVYEQTATLLQQGKKIGLIGGEHSTPLGYYKSLAQEHTEFGILQIDAHMDLRKAYENFGYSHASIFYNALKLEQITNLTQIGIRDCCDYEIARMQTDKRIKTFFDVDIKNDLYNNTSWNYICHQIIDSLPEKVHISLDIDGLTPEHCPNTGTPVPGGLDYNQVIYLLKQLKKSGKQIIGFDLCEVAGTGDFDANVGARLVYELCGVLS